MTQEEAIKILKDFHDESALFSVRTALETLYPELKESEDERIIKMLVYIVNITPATVAVKNRQTLLTWLEKQGEQKSSWSEEDEEMFDGIIADIQFSQKAHNHEVDQIVYEREIDWIKSIKQRIGG